MAESLMRLQSMSFKGKTHTSRMIVWLGSETEKVIERTAKDITGSRPGMQDFQMTLFVFGEIKIGRGIRERE